MMGKIKLINDVLLSQLRWKAKEQERQRQHYDLRTTSDDGSQRMLNVLEPGSKVPIHRHLNTSETEICIEGCIDWVFYEEVPIMDANGPLHNHEIVQGESRFKEIVRFRVCPREGQYGIQIPKMVWHTIDVHEPSTIFEAKDGKYGQ